MNLVQQGQIRVAVALAWHAFIGRCQASFNVQGPAVEGSIFCACVMSDALTMSAGLFGKFSQVGRRHCSSSLDAGSATPLTPNDFVPFFESTFSLAVFALLFLLVGLLLHVVILCAAASSKAG
jgi:prepilin signal peptidase PulO-like enzyme (type II secretory pathway)